MVLFFTMEAMRKLLPVLVVERLCFNYLLIKSTIPHSELNYLREECRICPRISSVSYQVSARSAMSCIIIPQQHLMSKIPRLSHMVTTKSE